MCFVINSSWATVWQNGIWYFTKFDYAEKIAPIDIHQHLLNAKQKGIGAQLGSGFVFTAPTPRHKQDVRQGYSFKLSLVGLNSEFSFSWISYHTKVKELSLPNYLSITEIRIIGGISFSRVFCSMSTASFRIWTQVIDSISNEDNHYTTGIYIYIYIYIYTRRIR